MSRTLRLRGASVKSFSTTAKSISSSKSISHSVKSNTFNKASSRFKIETAGPRPKQLEEKHELKKQDAALKQKRLEEKNAFKHKFEMLQASQQLEEAVLEQQVLEEEMERAGYITPEELLGSSSESEQVAHDLFSNMNKTDVNAAVVRVPPTSNHMVINTETDKPSVSGFRQSAESNQT